MARLFLGRWAKTRCAGFRGLRRLALARRVPQVPAVAHGRAIPAARLRAQPQPQPIRQASALICNPPPPRFGQCLMSM